VQFAAADALLRIPNTRASAVSSQIIEILRRALAGDATAKAAVADFNNDRAMAVADGVRQAGFEPVVVRTSTELLKRLNQAAEIDIVLVDHRVPDPEIRWLLGQLRGDVHFGRLPVVITMAPNPATPAPDPSATSPGALRRRFLAEQAN